jgi:hypothetical protein
MYGFKWYERAFLLALPVALVSLLTPSLNWLYALTFFAASFPVVFEIGKPKPDPQHSSTTHFERSSRWNRISYAKCAYLVLCGLVYGLLPHLGPVLVFTLWLGGLAGLWSVEQYWEPRLLRNLMIEYISSKLPEHAVQSITNAIDTFLTSGEFPRDEQVKHYLKIYIENNL